MNQVVGIDVGGTFTDLIVLDDKTGKVRISKVPSTPENQAFGVLNAIGDAGVSLNEVDTIIHGTTVTTNALLERKVAACGLITTKGFRDSLELGRRTRPRPYGMTGTFECLIPRDLRLEVTERMDASGNAILPLNEREVREAGQHFLSLGIEAVVIHFLHSYVNDTHERTAERIIREIWPNQFITRGSAIMAEYREYERGTTAIINAAVQPVLDRYIGKLQSELSKKGYPRDLLVMQGNGGTVSSQIISKSAVNTVMSGPASGVIAAAYTASESGYPNVITCDMGGTSCDVGLIRNGVPQVSSELEIEYAMPIHVPMVDVRTIGAGGGSIAHISPAGILEVGPESAGAVPGPICYGRGGNKPTITDANMVLGRLNPSIMTAAKVEPQSILDHLEEQIVGPLGLSSPFEAAAAIIKIANTKMAGALRMVSLARGYDPRDFVLFPFGGAGPLHASDLALELGVPKVLVPARPGITNAVGCSVADVRHDFVRTVNKSLSEVDMGDISAIFLEQERNGKETIEGEKIAVEEIKVLRDIDMQFQGQTHILTIEVDSSAVSRDALHDKFAKAYWDRFSVSLEEIRPMVVNVHTAVIGKRKAIALKDLLDPGNQSKTPEAAQTGERNVWFEGNPEKTIIYQREALPMGVTITGPAVIEQLDTTLIINPMDSFVVDSFGNIVLTIGAR
ncbi:MAG: hydantoinase/oxoprolinase family protein [Rhodospirillaceae bacterium]